MKRLLILLSMGMLGLGVLGCDYGMMPGETFGQDAVQVQGRQSSGLVAMPGATASQPGTHQNPAAGGGSSDGQQSQGEQGHGTPGYTSGIGHKVSPFMATPGSKAHGDPKTW